MQRTQVWSLVGEIRSHRLQGNEASMPQLLNPHEPQRRARTSQGKLGTSKIKIKNSVSQYGLCQFHNSWPDFLMNILLWKVLSRQKSGKYYVVLTHTSIHLLDSTINILLYLLYCVFFQSFHLPFYLISRWNPFHAFQSCRHTYLTPKHFRVHIIN